MAVKFAEFLEILECEVRAGYDKNQGKNEESGLEPLPNSDCYPLDGQFGNNAIRAWLGTANEKEYNSIVNSIVAGKTQYDIAHIYFKPQKEGNKTLDAAFVAKTLKQNGIDLNMLLKKYNVTLGNKPFEMLIAPQIFGQNPTIKTSE